MPSGKPSVFLLRLRLVSLLVLLVLAAACTPGPRPDATPTPLPRVEPDLLLIPDAFRYEAALRPAGAADEPLTMITGQYRAGALAQTIRRGEDAPEELIVAVDPADGVTHSFTRASGDMSWTRWPGVGFDALFGLTSPLSALRLYPLVDEQAPGAAEELPDVSEATIKVQTVISAASVERLLKAGASTVAAGAEERAALELQLTPLFVPQTVTFWVAESGRVYQAAATLLTAGSEGQAAPWLEMIWRYWDYDDPAIAVAAPADFTDAMDLTSGVTTETASTGEDAPLASGVSLRVRVFALPGVPATDVRVAVYPARQSQALETQDTADAQFILPDGVYDVQVQAEKAETWLRDVVVAAGAVTSHDVLFDFGALALTVAQGDARPQVDIVIYPAGQRETWIDWRTENPTTARLPAGVYDIEVALPDFSATKRVEGIEVQAGKTVSVTVDLDR